MKLPTIGELNRRVELWGITHSSQGDINVQVNAALIGKVWAKIEPVGGVTYWSSIGVGDEVTHRIYIRRVEGKTTPEALENITEIVGDGVKYRVRRRTDVNGARRFTLLECFFEGVKEALNASSVRI